MSGVHWYRVEAPVPSTTTPEAVQRIQANLVKAALLVVDRKATWIPLGERRVNVTRQGNTLYVTAQVSYIVAGEARPGRGYSRSSRLTTIDAT